MPRWGNPTTATIVLVALTLLTACSSATKYDEFATCLNEENATFYGAFWCPNCAQQKELFRASADNLDYVECSTPDGQSQTTLCQAENIQSYPTWEFADGSRVTGVQPLETLAERTGCELPA